MNLQPAICKFMNLLVWCSRNDTFWRGEQLYSARDSGLYALTMMMMITTSMLLIAFAGAVHVHPGYRGGAGLISISVFPTQHGETSHRYRAASFPRRGCLHGVTIFLETPPPQPEARRLSTVTPHQK